MRSSHLVLALASLAGCPAPQNGTDMPATEASLGTSGESTSEASTSGQPSSTTEGPDTTPATTDSGSDTDMATTGPATTATTQTSETETETEDPTGNPTDTETDTDETTDTGEPPTPVQARITDENRHHETMFGGWGPHLRGLMRAPDDSLWFPVDAGPSVYQNQAIRYFHQTGDNWEEVLTQPHNPGIQQNAASVILGPTIYTYGVNIEQNYLEECYLHTGDLQHACNAILISGQVYTTPPSSNYVGAATHEGSTRVVWWTRVGQNGGTGDWIYTYNFGGGWNGPVVTPLNGGNDFAYVHAAFTAPGSVAMVGQLYYGQYPNGSFGAAVSEFSLGDVPVLVALEADEPGVSMLSSADLWVDQASGSQHVLARDDQGGVRYYFKPSDSPWAQHSLPLHTFPATFRARFLSAEGGDLWIARGDPTGGVEMLRVPGADPQLAIAWDVAEAVVIEPPGPGFAPPSAIYVESETYQTAPVAELNLAYCGEYMTADNEIWWATLVED